ncbi:MAG: PepSY domain-containing protein, partial [Lachnospiraceae bacterium]|nr:PepSY domain-containing protein [Lachnospiraceae bacterium]
MMLILISAAALFYGNVRADIKEPDVSSDQARQIALSDAGVTVEDVTFTKAKLDSEEGILLYEIDFYTDEREYEYEINARTGAVREREVTVLKEVVVENTEKPGTEETDTEKNTGAEALI